MNKFLDFSFLFKRIDFLEKAISVMLEDHQLKALHLCQALSISDVDDYFKRHKYRDRFIILLKALKR